MGHLTSWSNIFPHLDYTAPPSWTPCDVLIVTTLSSHLTKLLTTLRYVSYNDLVKQQTAVPTVEDSLHIVGVEEEAVLLPAQVGERRVGAEVAVQARRAPVQQITLFRCVHHFGFIWKGMLGNENLYLDVSTCVNVLRSLFVHLGSGLLPIRY